MRLPLFSMAIDSTISCFNFSRVFFLSDLISAEVAPLSIMIQRSIVWPSCIHLFAKGPAAAKPTSPMASTRNKSKSHFSIFRRRWIFPNAIFKIKFDPHAVTCGLRRKKCKISGIVAAAIAAQANNGLAKINAVPHVCFVFRGGSTNL